MIQLMKTLSHTDLNNVYYINHFQYIVNLIISKLHIGF